VSKMPRELVSFLCIGFCARFLHLPRTSQSKSSIASINRPPPTTMRGAIRARPTNWSAFFRMPREATKFMSFFGMVYASLAQNAKAEDQLKIAVQLNPKSAAARTNFGTILLHSGKAALAGEQFREALQLDPQSFDANHNLAEFLLQSERLQKRARSFELAHRIQPDSYDNGYDLAMADFHLGQLEEARK